MFRSSLMMMQLMIIFNIAGMERSISFKFADIFAQSDMEKQNERLIEQESRPKNGTQPLSFHKQYARSTTMQVSRPGLFLLMTLQQYCRVQRAAFLLCELEWTMSCSHIRACHSKQVAAILQLYECLLGRTGTTTRLLLLWCRHDQVLSAAP